MGERVQHCWTGRRDSIEEQFGFGSKEWAASMNDPDGTCMLPDGHGGDHDFTLDSEIGVSFAEVPE